MLASLSADGRFIAFLACPSNEVNKNAYLFCRTFVHDRRTHETGLITSDLILVDIEGYVLSSSAGPAISSNGRYIAIQSPPADEGPAQITIYDRQSNTTELVSVDSAGKEPRLPSWYPSISADGRYVAFGSMAYHLTPEDTTNTGSSVFLRKRPVASEGMAALHVAAFAACGAAVLASLSILGVAYIRRCRQAR
jgi:Tol biopolymer transport system component